MKRSFLLVIFCCLTPLLAFAEKSLDEKHNKWAIGFNLTETAGFIVGKYLVGWPVTFIPLHVDGNYCLNRTWGLGFGAVYRYENYYDKNPVNRVALKKLWTNYHEIFLMAGPRYSFFNQGNQGLYAALKAGLGIGFSQGGYAITTIAQPELGYSFLLTPSKMLFIDFAVGILFNLPLIENPKLGFSLTSIGWVVHRTIPILRFGIGFSFL